MGGFVAVCAPSMAPITFWKPASRHKLCFVVGLISRIRIIPSLLILWRQTAVLTASASFFSTPMCAQAFVHVHINERVVRQSIFESASVNVSKYHRLSVTNGPTHAETCVSVPSSQPRRSQTSCRRQIQNRRQLWGGEGKRR